MKELEEIKRIVEEVFGVDDIAFNNRKRELMDAKKAYGYLAREYTINSFDSIGSFIKKDHSTIFYYCVTSVPALLQSDKIFREKFIKCEMKIIEGNILKDQNQIEERLKVAIENRDKWNKIIIELSRAI